MHVAYSLISSSSALLCKVRLLGIKRHEYCDVSWSTLLLGCSPKAWAHLQPHQQQVYLPAWQNCVSVGCGFVGRVLGFGVFLVFSICWFHNSVWCLVITLIYMSLITVSKVLPGSTSSMSYLFGSEEQNSHRHRARERPFVESKWLRRVRREESTAYEGDQRLLSGM